MSGKFETGLISWWSGSETRANEPVPEAVLERTRITPDVAAGAFHLEQPLSGSPRGLRLVARLAGGGRTIAEAEVTADADLAPRLALRVPEEERRLWSPEDPFLYDLEVELVGADGARVDAVTSYAGLRGISLDGPAVKLIALNCLATAKLSVSHLAGGKKVYARGHRNADEIFAVPRGKGYGRQHPEAARGKGQPSTAERVQHFKVVTLSN